MAGQVAHPAARRDDAQPVAQLQVQVVAGEQVQVAAPDPGDDPTEAPGHVQLLDAAPGERGVGQQHAPEVDLAPVVGEVLVRAGAEPVDGHRDGGLGPDHHHPVARSTVSRCADTSTVPP